MSHPTQATGTPTCASCGSPVAGRFCSHCGASADPGLCPACRQPLSPGASFCHHCGTAAGTPRKPSREQTAWIVAGVLLVAVIALLIVQAGGIREPAAPQMANAGNAGPTASAGPAPDISAMTPEQRFDALFERVIRASEAGDSLTVGQFSPMALGAYALLDSTSNDLRFHAAMIHAVSGDFAGADILADSILRNSPGHLFAYLIRGEVADRRNDAAALAQSYRDFLDHYDAELRAGRVEYGEHKPILDDFRTRALASQPARP